VTDAPNGIDRQNATAAPAQRSVRLAFLQLLAIALVPLVILGVGRSAVQLQRSQALVEARLSERALETARAEAEVIRTAQALLRLLSENDDIRSGGVLCDLGLAKIGHGFTAFSNFSRFHVDGRLACSSTPAVSDVAFSRAPWWPAVDDKATFFVTGPQWGKLSKRQVLIAVQPVTTIDGRFDGVVTASIDLGWMERSLRHRGLGSDAVALVLDGEGRTLVSSRAVGFAPLDVHVGTRRVAGGTDAGGRRWRYAVVPLLGSFDGKRQLYVAYAIPEAQLFSATWWQAGFSLAQPLIMALLASLAIWFGLNWLVLRWLRELRQMAMAFTAGDYRARNADFDAAPAEFREVASAFYTMGEVIEQRDSNLRAALDRQNQLVKEIHHRVKNNLQIVMSLISLQADRFETESGRAALRQTRMRISALALVHRLLYETGEQTTMAATELLGGVCDLVAQAFRDRHDVVLRARFADDDLVLDAAIPLALWLVDAMSNAWLHGFPIGRGGTIDVALRHEGETSVLEVIDDGVGFVTGSVPTAAARGLRMLNGIGRQVGGGTEIVSTPGGGTIVRLRYPSGKAGRSRAE
jgi:two-component sensor histidine kinase